jgi:hypothetical protein
MAQQPTAVRVRSSRAEATVKSQPPRTAPAEMDFLGRPRLGLLEGFDISF